MIFPIGDTQVKRGYFPLFAYGFILLNVLVWFFQLQYAELAICRYGSIPRDILNGKNEINLLTSMFMHGGWAHLLGNMLFLWVFADNIEATIGSWKFVLFYLLGGLVASLVHIFFGVGLSPEDCCMPCGNALGVRCAEGAKNMCSGTIPSVGASGAISAVMGAYIVMFPKSKIKILILVLFKTFYMSALLFLGIWIAMQVFSGYNNLGQLAGGGTAWWAHIGGFIFGVAAGFLFRPMIEKEKKGDAFV